MAASNKAKRELTKAQKDKLAKAASARPRYPKGTVIDGKNVGGKFKPAKPKKPKKNTGGGNPANPLSKKTREDLSKLAKARPRWPKGKIIDGKNVGGKFKPGRMTKAQKDVLRKAAKERERVPARPRSSAGGQFIANPDTGTVVATSIGVVEPLVDQALISRIPGVPLGDTKPMKDLAGNVLIYEAAITKSGDKIVAAWMTRSPRPITAAEKAELDKGRRSFEAFLTDANKAQIDAVAAGTAATGIIRGIDYSPVHTVGHHLTNMGLGLFKFLVSEFGLSRVLPAAKTYGRVQFGTHALISLVEGVAENLPRLMSPRGVKHLDRVPVPSDVAAFDKLKVSDTKAAAAAAAGTTAAPTAATTWAWAGPGNGQTWDQFAQAIQAQAGAGGATPEERQAVVDRVNREAPQRVGQTLEELAAARDRMEVRREGDLAEELVTGRMGEFQPDRPPPPGSLLDQVERQFG